jgi:L-fuconolactonase
MTILDSHVHFWNPTRLTYRWLDKVPILKRTWEPEHFAEASKGLEVEGILFVECGRDPAENVEEAAWVGELAAREPRIRGIVAHASVERGRAVSEELAALREHSLVRGVRRLLQDEPDPRFCLQPEFVEGVRAVGEHGFTFDLCIFHHQLMAVKELVRRCPEVTFVLDHVGKPAIREGRLDPWRTDLLDLASLPNVWCKLSGMVTEADHANWRPEQLRPYIDRVLNCFGYARTMFGGDWPVSTLASSYTRWVEVVREAVSGASEEDRSRLFSGNAKRCYRL